MKILLVSLALLGGGAKLDVSGPDTCGSDADCVDSVDGPFCDASGVCTRCSGDEDCPEPGEICSAEGACQLPCLEDSECSAQEPICDPDNGQCVQCLSDDDCAQSQFCDGGFCVDDICADGEQRCDGPRILVCVFNGSAFETQEVCPEGLVCQVESGQATCVAPPEGSTGGDSSGGDDTPGPATSDESGGADSSMQDDAVDRGCGCTAASPSPTPLWLLVLLAFRRRR